MATPARARSNPPITPLLWTAASASVRGLFEAPDSVASAPPLPALFPDLSIPAGEDALCPPSYLVFYLARNLGFYINIFIVFGGQQCILFVANKIVN